MLQHSQCSPNTGHDDVIKWKHFPWLFVRGTTGHRWIPLTKTSDVELSSFLWSARLDKRPSKQSRRRWFETPSRLLWRHWNVLNGSLYRHPLLIFNTFVDYFVLMIYYSLIRRCQWRHYFLESNICTGFSCIQFSCGCSVWHDDVIKWKHFPRYWPFVRGIHRSPVNSPHKGQWPGALMFS